MPKAYCLACHLRGCSGTSTRVSRPLWSSRVEVRGRAWTRRGLTEPVSADGCARRLSTSILVVKLVADRRRLTASSHCCPCAPAWRHLHLGPDLVAAFGNFIDRWHHVGVRIGQVRRRVFTRTWRSTASAQPCQGWGHGFESRRPLSLR